VVAAPRSPSPIAKGQERIEATTKPNSHECDVAGNSNGPKLLNSAPQIIPQIQMTELMAAAGDRSIPERENVLAARTMSTPEITVVPASSNKLGPARLLDAA